MRLAVMVALIMAVRQSESWLRPIEPAVLANVMVAAPLPPSITLNGRALCVTAVLVSWRRRCA